MLALPERARELFRPVRRLLRRRGRKAVVANVADNSQTPASSS
jgi:hypothetical protein